MTTVTRRDAKALQESRGRQREEKWWTGRRLCIDPEVKGHRTENKLEAGLKNCSFKINFSMHWLVTRRRAATRRWHSAIIWPNMELFFVFWLPGWQPLVRTGLSSDWPLLFTAFLYSVTGSITRTLILNPDPIRRKWGARLC